MSGKSYKIMMVSHVTPDSIYGAGSSLRQHMELMTEHELSLFSPLHRKADSVKNDVKVVKYFCPITYNYDVKLSLFRVFVLSVCSRLAFWVSAPWVLYKIFKLAPDVVHLNSLVLSDFLLLLRVYKVFKNVAVVSHVREMLGVNISWIQKYLLSTCDHYLFIDKAVQQRFAVVMGDDFSVDVVQNPFKGTVESNVLSSDFERWDRAGKVLFAIAGRIENGKGVLEICNSFSAHAPENALLLIAGGGSATCLEELKAVVEKSNGSVVYLGEIPNLQSSGFFGRIDFLIRGEPFFCTGRTVYESIYSGSKVIVPGEERDISEDEVLVEFRDQVFCYTPGDFKKLMSLVERLSACGKSPENRCIRNNYDKYCNLLNAIYSKVIK